MFREKEPIYNVWTDASKFCYRRGCNCRGCYMREIIESPCLMKKTVLRLVAKLGVPSDDKPNTNQKKVMDAIREGADSYESIAELSGVPESCVRSVLTKLYPLAEADGVVYKSKRFKFPQFIKWVRGKE